MRSVDYLTDLPGGWTYDLAMATQVNFSAKPGAEPRTIIEQPWQSQAATLKDENAISMSWTDQPPEDIAFHVQMLSVEMSDDNVHWQPLVIAGRPIDDEGYDVAVVLQARSAGKAIYEGRWYSPDILPGKFYRFAITGGKAPLYSNSFGRSLVKKGNCEDSC
jgi:hypothetical protein